MPVPPQNIVEIWVPLTPKKWQNLGVPPSKASTPEIFYKLSLNIQKKIPTLSDYDYQ